MQSKLAAARRVTQAGGSVIIASGTQREPLTRILAGEPVGTLFLAHGARHKAAQTLDRPDGAAEGLLRRGRRSATRARVELEEPARDRDSRSRRRVRERRRHRNSRPLRLRIRRGLTNYATADAKRIRGLRTHEARDALGRGRLRRSRPPRQPGADRLRNGCGTGVDAGDERSPAGRPGSGGRHGRPRGTGPPRRAARHGSRTRPRPRTQPPSWPAARLSTSPSALALDQALPAATKAADPYNLTFALIGLAKAQNVAGDRDSALKTFVEADRVAGRVADQHLRRLAVMRTAVARGRLGDSAPARARSNASPAKARARAEARYNLMSMVIDFRNEAGFKDDARASSTVS